MSNKKHIVSQDDTKEYRLWQAPDVIGIADSQPEKDVANSILLRKKNTTYKAAFEFGFKEGKQQGYQEGKEEAKAQTKEKIAALALLLNSLAAPLNELDEVIEKDLVVLVLLIARHLIRREIKTAPGEVVAVVHEALSALPDIPYQPTIYLHPEDVDIVKKALSLNEEQPHWKIKEDLLLARGDCRVETSSSYIDATMENRLSAIAAKMLSGERDSDDTA